MTMPAMAPPLRELATLGLAVGIGVGLWEGSEVGRDVGLYIKIQ
jgi:hypothetical protein